MAGGGHQVAFDLVEEAKGERYPVETKHGSAPRDQDGRPTVWDNDAVQLCAQGMLLEESTGQPVARLGATLLYIMWQALLLPRRDEAR